MNLYRIDPPRPMDPLFRRLSDAKPVAVARARELGRIVTITTINGRTLRLGPVRHASPSGRMIG